MENAAESRKRRREESRSGSPEEEPPERRRRQSPEVSPTSAPQDRLDEIQPEVGGNEEEEEEEEEENDWPVLFHEPVQDHEFADLWPGLFDLEVEVQMVDSLLTDSPYAREM